MPEREIHHQTDHIRASGDDIDDAVNSWSDATILINDAWLPWGALGIIEEEVGSGGTGARAEYEGVRNDAINRLNASTDALINVRESLYRVADEYDGVEDKSAKRSKDVGLTHRPDI